MSVEHPAHPALQHQFDSLQQQKEAATLGMWTFLAQEVLFFGGLFTAYTVYRFLNPEVFAAASATLPLGLGALNTGVLLLSSFTMVLAVWAAEVNRKNLIVLGLILTLLLGAVFLGVKTVEYKGKWDHHLVPGPNFHWDGLGGDRAQIFFLLYFIMTGMHALHMVIGMGLMIWFLVPAWKGRYGPDYLNPIECLGLYWHFVDIVWIFLFPLLYLLGGAAAS